MKFIEYILFYTFFSLTTLSLTAQKVSTEVVAEKSQIVSKKLGISKTAGDSTCIGVSQNSDSLRQGQEVVITVKGCQNFEMLKVLVGGILVEIDEARVAKLTLKSGMIGTHEVPVSIVYRSKDGGLKTESYTVTYKVRTASSQ